MYIDPVILNIPIDAVTYVSSNQEKVLALKAALWANGFKVQVREDKRVDHANSSDTQDVWILMHNAPDYKFREIRSSIAY